MNDIMMKEIGAGSSMITNEQLLNQAVSVGIGKDGIQVTADGDFLWGFIAMGIVTIAGMVLHDIMTDIRNTNYR